MSADRYGRFRLGAGFRVHAVKSRRTLCGRMADWDVSRTKSAVSCKQCLKVLDRAAPPEVSP